MPGMFSPGKLSPLRSDLASRPRVPAERTADVALALARVAVPEQIPGLINGHDDVRKSADIGDSAEDMLQPLPAIADRIARVRMPAGAAGQVRLAAAEVAVPEQVAILRGSEEHVAGAVYMPEVLPAIADRVAGIRVPPRAAGRIVLALALV